MHLHGLRGALLVAARWLAHLEQFVDERAIVDDRLAQVLGVGLAAVVAPRNRVRGPVVLDHRRMVDRNVGRPVLEVADRLAAAQHQFAHQLIGFRQRAFRVVDEAHLQAAPRLAEMGCVRRGQRHDVQLLHALFTRPQFGLGLGHVAMTVQRTLRTWAALMAGEDLSGQPLPGAARTGRAARR